MERHLHMFEGVVARFNVPTVDRRVIVLPFRMRAERRINSRPLPVPLMRVSPGLGASGPMGWVCAAHEGQDSDYNSTLHVSGILDLNEFDMWSRAALLDGGQVQAGADLDDVTTEPAKGLPCPDVTHLTDWRLKAVAAGPLYQSAWNPVTYIKLQTGPYADLSKID